MAAGRSKEQLDRIKKARNSKTGRFVVTHVKTPPAGTVVREKSVGRAVAKTRTYGRSVPASEVPRKGDQQPRPKIPLLPGGKDPTLGERFEEELFRS